MTPRSSMEERLASNQKAESSNLSEEPMSPRSSMEEHLVSTQTAGGSNPLGGSITISDLKDWRIIKKSGEFAHTHYDRDNYKYLRGCVLDDDDSWMCVSCEKTMPKAVEFMLALKRL